MRIQLRVTDIILQEVLSFSLRSAVPTTENVCHSCRIFKGAQEHAGTLQRNARISQRTVAIHPRFNKLITSIRTSVKNGEGILDKESTGHDDLFDAFRMSLMFWH